MIKVRFAPSPTGMLHIGSVRTALFNYIFAKSIGGKFFLRIEDTDKERSTQEATNAILDGLSWLRIKYDDEIVYQSHRCERHKEIAESLVKSGNAYYAYDTKEELDLERETSEKTGKSHRYSGKWRDSREIPPSDIKPVVRLKVPKGEILVKDLVKGDVKFDEKALDDFIILRSDGTPTYLLAAVVDDIDMEISHIIRGDDHLSNTPKQILIYNAIGVKIPQYAHIPLIFGEDGKKMSKRRNAVAVSDYQNLGILPEALKNYLLNLGWSYQGGDIISENDAISQFKIEDVGLSASRFDMQKLYNVNLHYIQAKKPEEILELIKPNLEIKIAKKLEDSDISILLKIMPELQKCNSLNDITNNAVRYISDKLDYSAEGIAILKKNPTVTQLVIDFIANSNFSDFKSEWDTFLKANSLKFGEAGPVLRVILIGIPNATAISSIISTLPLDIVKKRGIDVKNCI